MIKGAITIGSQLSEILDEYNDKVIEVTSKAAGKAARDTAKDLQNKSPKGRSGDYARGWAVKREKKLGRIETGIVYNKTDYQLTHLLENGHMIVNKYGSYGRTNGIKHIEPAEERGSQEFEEEIRKGLA